MPEMRRLLAIQFGQLGDTILSLPALDVLREAHPGAELTVACGMPANEVIALWGRADRIEPMDRVRVRDSNPVLSFALIIEFIKRIWKPTPDAAVVLHPNAEMQLVAFCTGARRRCGMIAHDGFFSRLLTESLDGTWWSSHAATSYLALARQFCGLSLPDPECPPVPSIRLAQPPERLDRVAIHIGASRKQKRVHRDTWLEVARLIALKTGAPIAFIGGPEEPRLAGELAQKVEGSVALTDLSIAQLAREIARSHFFLGTDSGPGHLAAALGTPSLTLIEKHVRRRYHTLGPEARHLAHDGIRDLTAEAIVEGVLAHPACRELKPRLSLPRDEDSSRLQAADAGAA
jgi:ADP-heptose:LPS heptosyltransferase